MRLQNLKLVRYGKFTDTEIALPEAEHDFHLIVGPNEAGKSTIRGAIADLLYGIPTRAAGMAFIHPQPILCLAAQVADGDARLDFVRTKAQRDTLRSPTDAVLPEESLGAFLGPWDRSFFEKMFGLDHAQLVAGGESILDASKDVSQVLFQSAAGVAGLGRIKDALRAEADGLWAPRRAGSRAYYTASDQLEQANRDLKAATVRPKAWGEARDALTQVEASITAATEKRAGLQATRSRLERIRRIAPMVQAMRSSTAELEALGDVVELPTDASAIVHSGTSELAVAKTVVGQHELAVTQYTEQRDAAVFDRALVTAKDDIEALAAFGQRVRDHYTDLETQHALFDKYLSLAGAGAAELGWPQDEIALRASLPASTALRDVQRLASEHGKLAGAKDAAADARQRKQEELDQAVVDLTDTPNGEIASSLRSAVAEAQNHRNTLTIQARLTGAVKSAEHALDAALASLGVWRRELAKLRGMSVPSAERLAGMVSKRQGLESELMLAKKRVEDAQLEGDTAKLAASQYAEARHVVTAVEVRAARDSRDGQWHLIKQGREALAAGALGLDIAIALADELVDAQLGSATEAAELQSLRQRAERAGLEIEGRSAQVELRNKDLQQFEQDWQATAISFGLAGLELGDAKAWLGKRDQALEASAALAERKQDLNTEAGAAGAAALGLRTELHAAKVNLTEAATLPTLLMQAETLVSAADGARARRQLLMRQADAAKTALTRLQATHEAAEDAYTAWQQAWAVAVSASRLSDTIRSVADAEQALARVETIRQNLDKAAETKRDRIDSMNRDLETFEGLAQALVQALGLVDIPADDPRQVLRVIHPRLKEAEAIQSRQLAASEGRESAIKQFEAAKRQVEQIMARISPLLSLAQVQTPEEAMPLVERSDTKRRLALEIAQTRVQLAKEADGLHLEAAVAEVDACDLTRVEVDAASVGDELDQVQSSLTKLAEERLKAELALNQIGGGNDAAAAESRRQEALASMADASERFIKVTAAAKLLTWAIDRYRELNQGPMLARAGAIFSTLTLRRYSRLFVDYDKTPVALSAQRDGGVVEVSGMSEGTRDQLYLALRIAALELHLEKAKALPFIVDDLFINFDDERSAAGLQALRQLSKRTQIIFLSHHDHLLPAVRQVFGGGVNVMQLQR
jgi:chromosome segregation protein